jgi:hypothetical protein
MLTFGFQGSLDLGHGPLMSDGAEDIALVRFTE